MFNDKCGEGLDDLRGASSLDPDFEGPQPPDKGLEDGSAHNTEVRHCEDGRRDVVVMPRRGDRESTAHETAEQRRVDTMAFCHRDKYLGNFVGVEECHHVPHIDEYFPKHGRAHPRGRRQRTEGHH